jgi:ribokinase
VPPADGATPAIVVVGSSMTDMVVYADRVPEAGETVVGNRFSLGFGGKGANQAVMCALLGASVQFVGCLGDDVFGRMTLQNFESFGIDVSRVRFTDRAATGAAPIWVDASGENRIIVVPGANDILDVSDVGETVRSARADVVIAQLEVPDACVAEALKAAADAGSASILNPAPMGAVDRPLLESCSWLIPNRSELAAIAGLLGFDRDADPAELARRCVAELETNVVVTLGADGVLLCTTEAEFAVAAPQVTAVDTTGAGDAFVGAFAYAIATGAEPRDAAAFGCSCATASVELRGTQTSFPRGDRLDALKQSLAISSEQMR